MLIHCFKIIFSSSSNIGIVIGRVRFVKKTEGWIILRHIFILKNDHTTVGQQYRLYED